MNKMIKNKSGFGLVEILISLGVILAFFYFFSPWKKAKETKDISANATLINALQQQGIKLTPEQQADPNAAAKAVEEQIKKMNDDRLKALDCQIDGNCAEQKK